MKVEMMLIIGFLLRNVDWKRYGKLGAVLSFTSVKGLDLENKDQEHV